MGSAAIAAKQSVFVVSFAHLGPCGDASQNSIHLILSSSYPYTMTRANRPQHMSGFLIQDRSIEWEGPAIWRYIEFGAGAALHEKYRRRLRV